MKENVEGRFNTRLIPSDWRFSAAVVGLIRYFNFHDIDFLQAGDYIEYNKEDIVLEKYLEFVEYYFEEYMHHRRIEQLLESEIINEEITKLINEKLKANAVCKRVFKGLKYEDDNSKKIIQAAIQENRNKLIQDTYKNAKKMYAKYLNSNCFYDKDDKNKTCRLIGFNVDAGRKTRALAYNWDYATYVYSDIQEFDFIPFAFTKTNDAFFINNNSSIRNLLGANNAILGEENIRQALFENTQNSTTFIEYDVEVIIKKIDTAYYETLFIRQQSINIFRQIKNYSGIQQTIKMSENYYINLENEVVEHIIQGITLDKFIELLLKKPRYRYNVKTLIEINQYIYGGNEMTGKMKGAFKCAKQLIDKIEPNKLESYKQKLISAITFKDYDRFCEILLQLSSYSGVVFNFAYDLFEDFEGNKNIAYTFINTLNNEKKGKSKEAV